MPPALRTSLLFVAIGLAAAIIAFSGANSRSRSEAAALPAVERPESDSLRPSELEPTVERREATLPAIAPDEPSSAIEEEEARGLRFGLLLGMIAAEEFGPGFDAALAAELQRLQLDT